MSYLMMLFLEKNNGGKYIKLESDTPAIPPLFHSTESLIVEQRTSIPCAMYSEENYQGQKITLVRGGGCDDLSTLPGNWLHKIRSVKFTSVLAAAAGAKDYVALEDTVGSSLAGGQTDALQANTVFKDANLLFNTIDAITRQKKVVGLVKRSKLDDFIEFSPLPGSCHAWQKIPKQIIQSLRYLYEFPCDDMGGEGVHNHPVVEIALAGADEIEKALVDALTAKPFVTAKAEPYCQYGTGPCGGYNPSIGRNCAPSERVCHTEAGTICAPSDYCAGAGPLHPSANFQDPTKLFDNPLIAHAGCLFPGGVKSAHFKYPPFGYQNIRIGMRLSIVAWGDCSTLYCNGGQCIGQGDLSMTVSQIDERPNDPFFRYILTGR